MAQELRRRARAEIGIPITVGVGRTKLMAKLASRAGKPDGIHVIGGARERELRSMLAITDLWGIGERTVDRLRALGVRQLFELDRVDDAELRQVCGALIAGRLRQMRNGTDDATVRPVRGRTSFSSEGSVSGYARPDRTPLELVDSCLRRACHRAGEAGLVGSVLTVSLRPADGSRPRQLRTTAATATADRASWMPRVRELLVGVDIPALVGLGVTLSALVPADRVPPSLF